MVTQRRLSKTPVKVVSCGYCSYDEAEGELLKQCDKCKREQRKQAAKLGHCLSEVDRIRTKLSKKLSKKVVVTVQLTEGDLALLRRRWKAKHKENKKKYPKLTPPFTDELLIKYVIWEAKSVELKRTMDRLAQSWEIERQLGGSSRSRKRKPQKARPARLRKK